jgi:hypothetical protein
MITLLGQILQQALDYELIDRNPVRVGGRSARFLKRVRPNRTFLEVDEFHALLRRRMTVANSPVVPGRPAAPSLSTPWRPSRCKLHGGCVGR